MIYYYDMRHAIFSPHKHYVKAGCLMLYDVTLSYTVHNIIIHSAVEHEVTSEKRNEDMIALV